MVGSSHVVVCDIDEGSDWVSVGKQRDNSTVVETTRRFFYVTVAQEE